MTQYEEIQLQIAKRKTYYVLPDLLKMLVGLVKVSENNLKAACTLDIPSKVFLGAYQKLIPIEDLEKTEKEELWVYTKGLFPGAEKEELIKYCKVVYTYGEII